MGKGSIVKRKLIVNVAGIKEVAVDDEVRAFPFFFVGLRLIFFVPDKDY